MTRIEEIVDQVYEITVYYRKRDLGLYIEGNSDFDLEISNQHLDISDITSLKRALSLDKNWAAVIFQAEDLFSRQRVEPLQSILDTWIRGAKAQVMGQEIPFSEIITWCQEADDTAKRRILKKEARSLCRFLAPFSHATWKALTECVEQDLGYRDYFSFCQEKKGEILSRYPDRALSFLEESSSTYFPLMSDWLSSIDSMGLDEASRFDAIYVLGLRYLDHLFPAQKKGVVGTELILDLFKGLLPKGQGISVHIQGKKGRQSYCIPVEIPWDVHVVAGPVFGWQDLEALCHELGHALFFANNFPGLNPGEKDYFQSAALSEAFAFLFQLVSMSEFFLTEILSLEREVARLLEQVHKVKFLTLCRRYAAKAFIEYENFRQNRVSHGQELYADIMKRHTGFQYDPETYLFDLMPDFYSIDYFEAFLAAAILKDFLEASFGRGWFLDKHAQDLVKSWWQEGNRHVLERFLKDKLEVDLDSETLADFMEGIDPVFFKNVKKMAQIV